MKEKLSAVCARGGTSKCILVRDEDLPLDLDDRVDVLLRAFGSPDVRQIDGVGGGTSLTSKACIISPPSTPNAHLDYTFAQVAVADPVVDFRGTCGNCASAVAVYAVTEGYVQAVDGVTEVRIYNTNTSRLIVAEVPTPGGVVATNGEFSISGVPRPGARLRLWFVDPAGSGTGKLLPTGASTDIVGGVRASIVDAAAPVVFFAASEMGLDGTELPGRVDGDGPLLAALERVRGEAAAICGFVTEPLTARIKSPGTPKIAWVAPARDYSTIYGAKVQRNDVQFVARIMSMGRLHAAFAITGAIATAVAVTLDGAPLGVSCPPPDGDGVRHVRFGHPSGTSDVFLKQVPAAPLLAGVDRTARVIWRGHIELPRSLRTA